MTRRSGRILAVLSVALVLALGALALAQRQFLSIGGGSTGGTFNVFASGMGDYLGRQVPNLNLTVEGSAGSAENIRRIQGGDLEMGIAFAGDAYLAYNGLDAFEGQAATNLRAVGFLYNAVSQVVTLKGSGITSLRDLQGRTVAVGGAGSGTQLSLERMLEALGVEITPVFIAGQNASDALKNRQVDAYHALFGVPNAAVTDTASTADIHIVSTYDDLEAAGFFEAYPFYSRYDIQPGSFRGVDEEVATITDPGLWVVSAAMSDDLVYELTKALYSDTGLEHMRTVTSVAGEMGMDTAMTGVAIPLHPGAARFWQEMGVAIPEAAQP
jgi:uncharacterized protein